MTTEWNGDAITARVRAAAVRGLGTAIGIVEARAIYLVTQTAKSGRVYRKRGVEHRASAPGQPFASNTGDTINRRRTLVDAVALRATLVFHSINAARMEHGTRRMRPRPFARRALSESSQQCHDAVNGEIERELR